MKQSDKDQYSPDEADRRRDDAIRRALNTPPKPLKELVGTKTRDKNQSAKRGAK